VIRENKSVILKIFFIVLNLPYYIYKKLSRNKNKFSISSRIIKISTISVSIGILVTLISFSVGKGLQKEIKDKIFSIQSDIIISSYENIETGISLNPIERSKILNSIKNENLVYSNLFYSVDKPSLLLSNQDFESIVFRGIDKNYDINKFNELFIKEGKVLSQINKNEILISHFVRRKLDPLALGKKDKEKAGGDRIRQTISLVEGIEQDISKKITSEIKSSKMKIQAKINGNELRIDGKKRDDLQSAMQLIEDLKIGIPVQFINFRD